MVPFKKKHIKSIESVHRTVARFCRGFCMQGLRKRSSIKKMLTVYCMKCHGSFKSTGPEQNICATIVENVELVFILNKEPCILEYPKISAGQNILRH